MEVIVRGDLGGSYNQPMTEEKKSLFERYAQFIVPGAVAVATMFQKQKSVALALIGLGFVSLAASTVPWLLKKLRQRKLALQERRQTATAMVDMGRYVRKFNELAGIQNTDTLHYVVFHYLCGTNGTWHASLELAPAKMFFDLCEILTSRYSERVRRGASYEDLRATVEELNNIVSSFCSYYARPIYEKVPGKLRPELAKQYTPLVEEGLVQYRERLVAFLASYGDFLKELDQSLRRPLGLGFYFEGPKPLKALSEAKAVLQP
jgi:hypothetical protein